MSGGRPPSQPLTPPSEAASIVALHWTPEQALAVFECLQALRQALERSELFLIKPSLSELGTLAGEEISEPEHLVQTASRLLRGSRCRAIMVSLGAQGALLASRDGIEQISAPNVRKVSTVGAGDSLSMAQRGLI